MRLSMIDDLVRCNGTMTESQFLGWIRSALRSKSLRWAPRAKALELARRAYNGPNKQQKWEYQCSICKGWFKYKEVAVDHYPKAAGSMLSIADIGEFANNLYCETSNLRILCHVDHAAWTYSEKIGVSFEEAVMLKEVIRIDKEESTEDVVAFCEDYGYTENSSKAKRKKNVEAILRSIN